MVTARGALCAGLLVTLTLAVAPICFAQDEPESIYVANTKVITIREGGLHSSTRARAVAIEQAITDVISSQDTQNPNVTLKEVNGLWTIFVGDIRVVAVHPAEATANDLPAQSLGAMWVKNLREMLPKSTPLATLPGEEGGDVAPMDIPPPTAPVTMPARPSAAVPGLPAKPPIGAPTLIVRDCFNTVRALPEEEYVARREELVTHLIRDLTPFITGQVPSVVSPIGEPPPTTAPVTTPPEPVVEPVVEPTAGTETTSVAEPPTTTTAPPDPVVEAGTGTTPPPGVKAGDPAYAKVPQKNRIRDKLEASRVPYLSLRKEDVTAAKPVGKLLAACRDAFARGNFDEAELYVDSALRLLGVEFSG